MNDQKPVGIGARVEWDHRLWGRREFIRVTDDHSASCTTDVSGRKTAQTLVFGEQALNVGSRGGESIRCKTSHSLEVCRE